MAGVNGSSDRRLVRELRRWDLVALVINSILGAGIFGLPSRAFVLAGTYSLLAYLLAATAILLVVLCFAEVASRFSTTGGPYLYSRSAFPPFVSFQVGWLLWLARVAAAASLANLFVQYVAYFLPPAAMAPWRPAILSGLIAVLAAANVGGVRLSAIVTNVLTVGKLLPLVLLGIVGLFFVDPAAYSTPASPSYASFSAAALLLVFAYTGFEGAMIPSGEMRAPTRHLPFALLTGFSIVTLVYVAVQVVCIGTVSDLAHSERPLADAGLRVLGPAGASFIAAGALVSMAGTLNALTFATPRLLFAMSENGQLPRVLAATAPGVRTPALAIVMTAGAALVLSIFSSFLSALTLSAVVRLIVYATTCMTMLALRRRQGAASPAFLVPFGTFVAGGALGLIAWLLSNSPSSEIRLTALAIAAGTVLFYLARRENAKAAAV
jgi:amino acid transporter